MTIKEAIGKVKALCFSRLYELQQESSKSTSEDTKKALDWEIRELSEATHLVSKHLDHCEK
tara:strand:+ start:35 stop:217 length:183 start_codon:yes stop_codon:yes gene_type:complete